MTRKIEDIVIARLPTPSTAVAYYGSRDCPKLQLAIRNSGRKEWRFRYLRPEDGKRSTFTLGTFPQMDEVEAKKRVRELEADLRKGISPVTAKVVARAKALSHAKSVANLVGGKYTFIEMAAAFLEDVKKKGRPGPATLKKYRTGLIHHLQPQIGYWDVRHILVSEYVDVIKNIRDKGEDAEKTAKQQKKTSESAAKNAHASFRAMMSWLAKKGVIYGNPVLGLTDLLKEIEVSPRKRYLSPYEIHKFLNEIGRQGINDDTKLALLIQIHTGLRIGEICALEWNNIDFRARLITHPKTIMKSGKAAETVLSTPVFRLLAERRKATLDKAENRVFPESFNTDHVVAQVQNLKGWIDFGTHDLRRTVSTCLQELGCSSDVRDMITNHAGPQGVRRHYDHSKALQQQLDWLNKWGDTLAKLKEDPSAMKMAIDLDDSDPLMAEFADIL